MVQLDGDFTNIASLRVVRDPVRHQAIVDRVREVTGVQAAGAVVGGPLGSVSNDDATPLRTAPSLRAPA